MNKVDKQIYYWAHMLDECKLDESMYTRFHELEDALDGKSGIFSKPWLMVPVKLYSFQKNWADRYGYEEVPLDDYDTRRRYQQDFYHQFDASDPLYMKKAYAICKSNLKSEPNKWNVMCWNEESPIFYVKNAAGYFISNKNAFYWVKAPGVEIDNDASVKDATDATKRFVDTMLKELKQLQPYSDDETLAANVVAYCKNLSDGRLDVTKYLDTKLNIDDRATKWQVVFKAPNETAWTVLAEFNTRDAAAEYVQKAKATIDKYEVDGPIRCVMQNDGTWKVMDSDWAKREFVVSNVRGVMRSKPPSMTKSAIRQRMRLRNDPDYHIKKKEASIARWAAMSPEERAIKNRDRSQRIVDEYANFPLYYEQIKTFNRAIRAAEKAGNDSDAEQLRAGLALFKKQEQDKLGYSGKKDFSKIVLHANLLKQLDSPSISSSEKDALAKQIKAIEDDFYGEIERKFPYIKKWTSIRRSV